ncbi:MAG: hypothetical protein ACI86H_001072 [bacterium]|jgi:hypothetical protein
MEAVNHNLLEIQQLPLIFKKIPPEKIEELIGNKEKTSKETKLQKNRIFCGKCKNLITLLELSIPIQGSSEHIFENSTGIAFRIGCFSDAEGCIRIGSPTYDFTWFDDFSWQIALCANCHEHLGWCYQSSKSEIFYGLIFNQLSHS